MDGFNTKKYPTHTVRQFESDVFNIVNKVKFTKINNLFQKRLRNNMKKNYNFQQNSCKSL